MLRDEAAGVRVVQRRGAAAEIHAGDARKLKTKRAHPGGDRVQTSFGAVQIHNVKRNILLDPFPRLCRLIFRDVLRRGTVLWKVAQLRLLQGIQDLIIRARHEIVLGSVMLGPPPIRRVELRVFVREVEIRRLHVDPAPITGLHARKRLPMVIVLLLHATLPPRTLDLKREWAHGVRRPHRQTALTIDSLCEIIAWLRRRCGPRRRRLRHGCARDMVLPRGQGRLQRCGDLAHWLGRAIISILTLQRDVPQEHHGGKEDANSNAGSPKGRVAAALRHEEVLLFFVGLLLVAFFVVA
mmetsp:Transcript_59040/g.164956  ORF Transcript_59040/g.164956 Transcript_59040/m.164956 type:complete len:296 (+) Transcript_59040:615-1502(+)